MKNKILIFIFFIVLILSGCGKKDEVKQEEIDDIRELKETEINTLMDLVDDLYYFDINPAKSFKTSELTNQEVLLWAVNNRGFSNKLPFSELADMAMKYLDFSLEPENVLCMTHYHVLGTSDYVYLYDIDNKYFVKNDNHVSHSNKGYYSNVVNRYVESKYENGKYIITVVKLFSDTNYNPDSKSQINDYYVSYNAAKEEKNPVLKSVNSLSVKDKLIKMNNINELVKYTYTFKIKNDNYVLTNYLIEQ